MPDPRSQGAGCSLTLAILCACSALFGCAATKVETTGSPLKESLCAASTESLSTVVYWGAQWRPDQKEPALREAAALRGIQGFVAGSGCTGIVGIRRLTGQEPRLSDEQLLRLAAASAPAPERVVAIVVRELGPKLVVGIPAIVEGGTEVLIDVRVLNVRTAEAIADARTHWYHGGTFVIKGVKTLDRDMGAALRATLTPTAMPQ